jgi:hypothetical protein
VLAEAVDEAAGELQAVGATLAVGERA